MQLHHTFIVQALIAALFACSTAQNESPNAKPAQEPAPSEDSHPMAGFARMVSGEWQMKQAKSSTEVTQFDVWTWGPGEHSMRSLTDGSGGDGGPWRELQVMYWHPGRKQVCVLGLVPHGWGVAEGTMRFQGDSADASYDLYQHGNRRPMGARLTFDGPDQMHETLLEGGHTLLAEWDWFRSETAASTSPHPLPLVPELTEPLQVLAPLLGHTWQAKGELATGEVFEIRSTFEWVPYTTAIQARVFAPTRDGESTELLDVYFYDHTGRETLRCVALTAWGGVYEGDLTVLEGGALQLDLKGYEGDRVVPHVVRFDFEPEETLRNRVWSLEGSERTLVFDVHHKKLAPNTAQPVGADGHGR